MKNIKFNLLFFITLFVLLIGMVCAEDVDSADSTVDQYMLSNALTDTTESITADTMDNIDDVNDYVVNDNKIMAL